MQRSTKINKIEWPLDLLDNQAKWQALQFFVGAQNDGRIFFCASLHPCLSSLETPYIYAFFISTLRGLLLTLASCLIGYQNLVTVQATADCCTDHAILGAFSVCPGHFSSLQLEPTPGTYLYCLTKAKLFTFDATYSYLFLHQPPSLQFLLPPLWLSSWPRSPFFVAHSYLSPHMAQIWFMFTVYSSRQS